MQNLLDIFIGIVLILGVLNLLRLGLLMVGSDVYDIVQTKRSKSFHRPYIAVIISAHNEELCIIRTLESVLVNTYERKRVVVVDDGSTDSTYAQLLTFQKRNKSANLTIVRQENSGKAVAINNALKNHTRGSGLVMVLDADSILDKNAIANMVAHFSDKRIVAAAANVKVINSLRPLIIAQRFEYAISHRMKRALTAYNTEYIVGGVGSTFRRRLVQSCGYYDTDTMTEDIDFTVKLIAKKGNRRHKVIFASDVIAHTEGVMTFKSLVKQRFRWKYGRMQTFFKHKNLFFSPQHKHTKRLTWIHLPFIIFSELLLLLDPFIIAGTLGLAWFYGGWGSLLTVYGIVTVFYALNIVADDSEKARSKLQLFLILPAAYFLILLMSFVDFLALLQSIAGIPDIFRRKSRGAHWQHVERAGKSVAL